MNLCLFPVNFTCDFLSSSGIERPGIKMIERVLDGILPRKCGRLAEIGVEYFSSCIYKGRVANIGYFFFPRLCRL